MHLLVYNSEEEISNSFSPTKNDGYTYVHT